MKDLRVRDIMQRDVFCVRPGTPVTEFVAECVRRKITGTPVIDESEQLVGLLSLSDVAVAAAFPRAGDDGTVGALMTHPVHTVEPHARLMQAVKLFRQHQVHRLVVVYQGKVLGLLSPVDLLGRELESDEVARAL
jgi:CBS domain-containing protein